MKINSAESIDNVYEHVKNFMDKLLNKTKSTSTNSTTNTNNSTNSNGSNSSEPKKSIICVVGKLSQIL